MSVQKLQKIPVSSVKQPRNASDRSVVMPDLFDTNPFLHQGQPRPSYDTFLRIYIPTGYPSVFYQWKASLLKYISSTFDFPFTMSHCSFAT